MEINNEMLNPQFLTAPMVKAHWKNLDTGKTETSLIKVEYAQYLVNAGNDGRVASFPNGTLVKCIKHEGTKFETKVIDWKARWIVLTDGDIALRRTTDNDTYVGDY